MRSLDEWSLSNLGGRSCSSSLVETSVASTGHVGSTGGQSSKRTGCWCEMLWSRLRLYRQRLTGAAVGRSDARRNTEVSYFVFIDPKLVSLCHKTITERGAGPILLLGVQNIKSHTSQRKEFLLSPCIRRWILNTGATNGLILEKFIVWR